LKTLRQMIVPSDQPDVVESDEDQMWRGPP
jgi:hypothetical protein